MNEVPIGPDEYQARPRHMPPIFLSALAVMLLAFGGTLTIALPWNILDLINGREFQDLSRFQRFIWDLFAVFSFVCYYHGALSNFLRSVPNSRKVLRRPMIVRRGPASRSLYQHTRKPRTSSHSSFASGTRIPKLRNHRRR